MTFEEEQAGVTRHVTITGTRSVPDESKLPGLFDDYLRPFAAPDTHFYLGGAVGIDTAALDWLAENSQASLTVVVPCTVADQPAAAVASIRRQRDAGRLAQVVELKADRLGTAAYYARNRWMVDRSGFVVGFPRGTDQARGTWYTVNYAAEQGKPRLVVPV
jgi:predicted Rossmann fold nucleotide-binding protein DprA/Smf involved in DNA uptake